MNLMDRLTFRITSVAAVLLSAIARRLRRQSMMEASFR